MLISLVVVNNSNQKKITVKFNIGNKLIQQVKVLLAEQYEANQKLEVYSQILEEKIEERTQALRQKILFSSKLYKNSGLLSPN
ncbi:hypothetical protein [Nostoc foliaceum]|uniref:Uncharacterized protein n=1 Tax=Nostoc linckia FACHB-391 TaxID=2692906 RepID=A0ABR8ER43_NOSLI|nr:hypothetical protein [Nostoc linckia FACHB-391]